MSPPSLPTFRSLAARRNAKKEERSLNNGTTNTEEQSESDRSLTLTNVTNGVDIKRATLTRRNAIITACFFFFISVIFLLLTIIGNINTKAVIRDTYFFKLDLTNIIPSSVENIAFVNSLARSLGLHDFYQVGLWNFCEGYNDEGITHSSKPQRLYWFNPVQIILNELLSGATVALPANINDILNLIKIASNVMFGCFLTGICMNTVSIFITPVVLYSRWWSLAIATWTFIAALLTTIATVIATVMFVIFRNTITSQTSLNIGASLGNQMFGFMWVGAAFSIFGFVINLALLCCCASRRDVATGRRKGSRKAYSTSGPLDEKTPGMKNFARKILGRKKATGDNV